MLWSEVADGFISVEQQKTGKRLRIPMHRDLQALLHEIPRRAVTVLTNTRGKPWTVDGFKTSWNKELGRKAMAPIRKAGLVFHGLRKSSVVFLLEAGSTDAEVSAITGQSRQMVEHYARQVNQKKARRGSGPEMGKGRGGWNGRRTGFIKRRTAICKTIRMFFSVPAGTL
jgi:integrase